MTGFIKKTTKLTILWLTTSWPKIDRRLNPSWLIIVWSLIISRVWMKTKKLQSCMSVSSNLKNKRWCANSVRKRNAFGHSNKNICAECKCSTIVIRNASNEQWRRLLKRFMLLKFRNIDRSGRILMERSSDLNNLIEDRLRNSKYHFNF
jgi:hypothetical protein